MGVTQEENHVPEHYFCEQCRPEEHQELLAAIEKGEQIWLERQKATKKPRKGGKKGQKGGRQSKVSEIKPEDADTADPGSPAASTSQETGTKRKFDEDTAMVGSVLTTSDTRERVLTIGTASS